MSGARPSTWMPFYVGDYLRDTGHLSPAEHGAYLLLLFQYWTTGKPPQDDDEMLRRIARMTQREWTAARRVIEPFFTIAGGAWRHKRVEAELARWSEKKQRRSNAGSKGAAKRWQTDSNATPMPMANECPSPSPSPDSVADATESLSAAGAPATTQGANSHGKPGRGTRLAADWEPSAEDCAFASELGLDPVATAARFRDYWIAQPGQKGVKVDWPATWRNKCRSDAEKRAAGHAGARSGANRSGPPSVVAAFSRVAGTGTD